MTSRRIGHWLFIVGLLLLPHPVAAQDATLTGTITDATSGALPGVTVRAVHEESGNSFEAVTDARGAYRLAVRVGPYRVTTELEGFTPVTRTLTLLVGQQAVVDLQLVVASLQESVTVTAADAMLQLSRSSLGGNMDPRQLQELPVNGRVWTDLVLAAPGARVNAQVADAPSTFESSGRGKAGGEFQINLDGQQVTQMFGGVTDVGQVHYSRDTIAEFEFLSSRFDATQGRSSGVQVNAITKSGTNRPAGTFSGYFRDDSLNAADFVAGRVLPYQNRQLSWTFGGPVIRDRVHFFANFEHEREPQTFVWTTPYPSFNLDDRDTRIDKKGGLKLDAQFSSRLRLMVRGNATRLMKPEGGGAGTTPTRKLRHEHNSNDYYARLTQTFDRAVHEVKVGYFEFKAEQFKPPINNPASHALTAGYPASTPQIFLSGLSMGAYNTTVDAQHEQVYSARDDLTFVFNKRGTHTVKMGAEYLHQIRTDRRCRTCDGELDATAGPIPANIESLFPDLFDVTTWNLAPLSSITRTWRQAIGRTFKSVIPRYSTAVWLQDDWAIAPRLTLNLGIRYDLELNAFNNDLEILPWLTGDQPNDLNNVSPRVGFSYAATDRTVFRGGFGTYYATVTNGHFGDFTKNNILVTVQNDGRPDFAANPFNGPTPTYEQLLATLCTPSLAPGCARQTLQTGGSIFEPGFTMPYSYQASIGAQRQLTDTLVVEADYVYTGTRDFPKETFINYTVNPDTGANYPFSNPATRPYPWFDNVSFAMNGARSNYHGLQTAVTRRFSDRWQLSGNYLLSVMRDALPRPHSGLEEVPFETVPDLGGEYSLSVGDQRHRASMNGIWEIGYGFQASGLYFFGSGQRRATNWGTDRRDLPPGAENRLRPDGTIVPRNDFVGAPIHRVDVRLQRRFRLGGRAAIDGMVEVFNAFNHANYGSYTTQEVSVNYGKPQQSSGVAYLPRQVQLGFRLTF